MRLVACGASHVVAALEWLGLMCWGGGDQRRRAHYTPRRHQILCTGACGSCSRCARGGARAGWDARNLLIPHSNNIKGIAIAAGDAHTLALVQDYSEYDSTRLHAMEADDGAVVFSRRSLWSWGVGELGELGVEDTCASCHPLEVR